MISLVCISVNLAIAYFCGQNLRIYFEERFGETYKEHAELYTFMVVVLIEHIIILLKVLLASLISDIPMWVTNAEIEEQ